MNWILFLFKKYFSASSRRGIRLVRWLAISGVALGVGTLTLTQAVLSGFEKVFFESILGFNAHLVVLKQGEMAEGKVEEKELFEKLSGEALASTPFLYREGLFVSQGRVKGAVLKGIDPLTFSRVYAVKVRPLVDAQVPANIGDLLNVSGEFPAIVLGEDLALALNVSTAGETVKVFLPTQGDEKQQKNFRLFQVTGIFSTGLYEFDHGFAFVDLSRLQKIFQVPGVATGVEFKLKSPLEAEDLARELKSILGPYYDAVSWQKLNAPLFRALHLERQLFFVIISMVVAVAAFNIVGVLLLMIFEKSREISILRALGASRRGLKVLFGLEGLVLGAIGSMVGVGLGFLMGWVLQKTGWLKLPKEVYLVERLPVDFSVSVLISVVAISLLISIFATQLAVIRLKKVSLEL